MAFIALLSLLLSAMAFSATPVLGHTGSIVATQNCDGYSITAYLDDNVAAEATWEVSLDGTVLDSGTGPGPDTLGPYTGAPVAGTAELVIDFNDEHNVYTAILTLEEDCEEPGTIIIVKDTAPDAADDFSFAVTGDGLSAFMLDDDADVTLSNQRTFTDLASGSYTVTETAAAGYTLTTLSCTTGGAGNTTTGTATITLGAGQTVTCTFVNTLDVVPPPATGTITIVKDTAPDAAPDFSFAVTGDGLSAFMLDDDADVTLSNQRTFTDLASGSYTVTETAAAGYTLTTLSCTTGGAGNTTTGTATITLGAGQTVTCTFVNTVQLSGTLPSTGGPAAAPPAAAPAGGTAAPQTALPNTAVLPDATGATPATPGALLLLLGVGLGGYRLSEARRRR